MVQLSSQTTLDNLFAMLRLAVAHLAADATAQCAYLEELGTPESADELALEFDDAFGAHGPLAEAGRLSPSAIEALAALDATLADLSKRPDAWTPEALQTDPDWNTVRAAAACALELLGD